MSMTRIKYISSILVVVFLACGPGQEEINKQFFSACYNFDTTNIHRLAEKVDLYARDTIMGLTPIQIARYTQEPNIVKILQKRNYKNTRYKTLNIDLPIVQRRFGKIEPCLNLYITQDSIYLEAEAIASVQEVLKDKDFYIYNLKEKLNSIRNRFEGLSAAYVDEINFWGYANMPYKLFFKILYNCADFSKIYFIISKPNKEGELTAIYYNIWWGNHGGYGNTWPETFFLDLAIKVYRDGINVSIDPGVKSQPFWKVINIEEFMIANINDKYDYQKLSNVLTEIKNRPWEGQEKECSSETSELKRRLIVPGGGPLSESVIHFHDNLDYQTLISIIEHSHSVLDKNGHIKYLFPHFSFGKMASDTLISEAGRWGWRRIFEEIIGRNEKGDLDNILGSHPDSDTKQTVPAKKN